MDPTLFALITGPGKTPLASVALGCTGSGRGSNISRGDSRATESIRSNLFVDNGKRDVDHSSGDSLGDSGEEQSKAEKLQHREWMRRKASAQPGATSNKAEAIYTIR